MAHPHVLSFGEFGKQAGTVRYGELGLAVLGISRPGHPAAQPVRQQLMAVTNPQQRDVQIEDIRVDLVGIIGVDRGRPSRQDQSGWPARLDLRGGDVAGNDLREYVGLPDPPGDQLRVLGTEADDEDTIDAEFEVKD